MLPDFPEKVFSILGLRWRDRYDTIERTHNFHTDPPKEARPRGPIPGGGISYPPLTRNGPSSLTLKIVHRP